MQRKLSIVIGVCSLFFSHSVLAESGWTDFANTAELVSTSRHYYEVRLEVKENPSGCRKIVVLSGLRFPWLRQDV